ncbi:MAG TPA: metalloregulator ArsR/SmtB family transcription factor [Alphaproteobacteria bacterium]|jgi:ArsR family transcriptional regulator|nr:metalloregulator ArsR/SmtB family transcription factor [Alphaproteobacteria bacterium]
MRTETILAGLRAAAEPTRLRLIALCAEAELTVRELTQILGQSQPRVSRHLKVLCDAGLLDRSPEGTSVYFRLARTGEGAELARALTAILFGDMRSGAQPASLDFERLETVKRARAQTAAAYFQANAARWDQIRSLHVDEAEVERALLQHLGAEPIGELLDIGTGTGRILEILGSRAGNAIGVDLSREMLKLARSRIERAGLRNCGVKQGDMYQLPWPEPSFDAITIHQVLHYAERPAAVIAEAARVLRPGGRLAVVDFAPHELAKLREEHAHRHLGFADAEIARWCRQAGIEPLEIVHLPGKPLTVTLWLGRRPKEAAQATRAEAARKFGSPAERRIEA